MEKGFFDSLTPPPPFLNSGADLAALVREASMAALRVVMQTVPLYTSQRGDQTEMGIVNKHIVVIRANFESAFVKVKASVTKKVSLFKNLHHTCEI